MPSIGSWAAAGPAELSWAPPSWAQPRHDPKGFFQNCILKLSSEFRLNRLPPAGELNDIGGDWS